MAKNIAKNMTNNTTYNYRWLTTLKDLKDIFKNLQDPIHTFVEVQENLQLVWTFICGTSVCHNNYYLPNSIKDNDLILFLEKENLIKIYHTIN